MNERDVDLMQEEVEGFLKKLLEEYTANWVGDRRDDGDIYGEAGRQPGGLGEEMGSNDIRDIGR
jgi:hypothetical protein